MHREQTGRDEDDNGGIGLWFERGWKCGNDESVILIIPSAIDDISEHD